MMTIVTNVCNAKRGAMIEDSFYAAKTENFLFGGDGTYCFVKNANLDYEKIKPSSLSKTFFR